MKRRMFTDKQQEVLRLRYERRATLDEIAQWLGITRRSVLKRLRNAQKLAARSVKSQAAPSHRQAKRRMLSVSQVLSKSEAIDEL